MAGRIESGWRSRSGSRRRVSPAQIPLPPYARADVFMQMAL
ncbi:hypothetical protein [Micromonospora foliorum]|nr:hypothetical protein [Micromonospora foliorum]